MKLFRRFQVTFWGGAHRKTSVNVDGANLVMALNNVGAENVFIAENLILYFTNKRNSGKPPISSLCKIKLILRFIKCMEIKYKRILPDNNSTLKTMLEGMKQSLARHPSKRQVFIIENSRKT